MMTLDTVCRELQQGAQDLLQLLVVELAGLAVDDLLEVVEQHHGATARKGLQDGLHLRPNRRVRVPVDLIEKLCS
jgi:hypothetical protein